MFGELTWVKLGAAIDALSGRAHHWLSHQRLALE